MTLRFLHAADLHLDSPLRGLARYEGAPAERLRGATRRALERLVELALAERVAFVVLAGDIYDRDWQDFHTGLFFREQMVRLGRGGVRVFIAHGNHDAQGVISRQLELPEHVQVFSSRSAQTLLLPALGVALHGRSFPEREVPEDLVPHYPAAVAGLFNIGVLHTSLAGSPAHDTYAPTSLAALQAKGYDYWALGHVHARQVVCEQPRIVFPGNLQGRHANECGPKGCELVSVGADGRVSAEFVPLDVVRWTQLELALDGIDSLAAFQAAAGDALARLHATAPDRLHAVRLNLRGATPLKTLEARSPGTLEAAAQAAAQDLGEAEIWLERVHAELHAPLDRQAAAARDDAIGELARLVDELCADPQALPGWARQALGELLQTLPPEVRADGGDGLIPDLDDAAALRALLLDAEATVLARLAGTEERA
ncbi:metallophosphoesterase family protein [Caldimonas tepidiphila]|uniref:metallophosphoesterase family protein n=1 Tax=Caldimonas tepidiphila TaxID=2315841 RepID=UPI001F0C9124|nr:DNA repair exonuclease [Caldimonas tepidiphila]